MPKYVQVWDVNGPEWSGRVYDQSIALDKLNIAGKGATMEILTIVRHDDGSREYLPGTIASAVQAYREN